MSENDPQVQSSTRSGVTARSVLLGVLTAALMAYTGNMQEIVLHAGSLVKSSYLVALILWFCIWLGLNTILIVAFPRYALTRVEMMVIFTSAWIVGMMPGVGWLGYMVDAMPAPHFFASPENRWAELFLDHLPSWAFPNAVPQVVESFYFGLQSSQSIPWVDWALPLWWWFSGGAALAGAGWFVSCIFHRQWTDSERLTYPLVQFPLDLMEGFDEGRVPTLFKKPLFWAGFGWTAGIILWNVIGFWYPSVPRIGLFDNILLKEVQFARDFPPFYSRVLPPVIGLGYLCSLDLLFSFWLFGILAVLKVGVMNQTRISVGLPGQAASSEVIVGLESHGAMTLLVLWSLWIARRHLLHVWRCASSGERGDGPVPYRTAALGLALTTTYLAVFMMQLGLSLQLAVGQMALMFVAYFATVKYMAAGGFGYLFPVMNKGGNFLSLVTGTTGLSTSNLVGTKLINSNMFMGGRRLQTLQALPHHLEAMDGLKRGRAAAHWAVFVAFAVGFWVSVLTILCYAYTESALHLQSYSLLDGPKVVFNGLTSALDDTERMVFDIQKLGVWAVGGAEAGLLALLRSRFPWFPLHPLGLAFQYTAGPRYYVMSIMMVWAAKMLIVRYGGASMYEKAKPFFIGTVVGYCVGVGLSAGIDLVWFPGEGHGFHNY